jgi:predicted phosphodiesterase
LVPTTVAIGSPGSGGTAAIDVKRTDPSFGERVRAGPEADSVERVAKLRLAVVSDTHLSRVTPEAQANWEAVLRYLAADPPDLVIHAGDLTVDGTHDGRDLSDARQQLERLPVPWRAIPGNHDVGDNPRADQPDDEAIDDERRDRWLATVGPDWWTERLDGWTIVAVDAQLFESGLAAEAEQREWLDDQLRGTDATERVLLITHKPVAGPDDELATAPPYRFVPPATRAWLGELLATARVPLVVSGHVHQFRVLDLDGRRHAWAPTTWAVLPDDLQPTFGSKRCGFLSVELHDAGACEPTLIEPPDFRQLTLLRDIPSPYGH